MSAENPLHTNIPSMPKIGDSIILTKLSTGENEQSKIATGEKLRGTLLRDIKVGKGILLDAGNTSHVREIRIESGKSIIETDTSVYELHRDQ